MMHGQQNIKKKWCRSLHTYLHTTEGKKDVGRHRIWWKVRFKTWNQSNPFIILSFCAGGRRR